MGDKKAWDQWQPPLHDHAKDPWMTEDVMGFVVYGLGPLFAIFIVLSAIYFIQGGLKSGLDMLKDFFDQGLAQDLDQDQDQQGGTITFTPLFKPDAGIPPGTSMALNFPSRTHGKCTFYILNCCFFS